jgi:hypothetical protein
LKRKRQLPELRQSPENNLRCKETSTNIYKPSTRGRRNAEEGVTHRTTNQNYYIFKVGYLREKKEAVLSFRDKTEKVFFLF